MRRSRTMRRTRGMRRTRCRTRSMRGGKCELNNGIFTCSGGSRRRRMRGGKFCMPTSTGQQICGSSG